MAGCGSGNPRTYQVTGSIRFEDGSPMRTGYVEFQPTAGGTSARARVDSDGSFTLGTFNDTDGAPVGEYVAIVTQSNPPIDPKEVRKLGPEHESHADSVQVVSLKYASRSTSNLKFNVEPKKNHFDLTVESR